MSKSDWVDVTDEWVEVTPKKEFDVNTAIGNIPESAGNYVKAVTAPIHSPVETGTGLVNLASGAIVKGAKAIGLPVPEERMGEVDVKTFDAVKQGILERYGDWDKFKTTLEKDPIGTLADISTLFSGGSGIVNASGLTKTAKVLDIASKATDPLTLPKVGLKTSSNILKKGGQGTYESALKVPPSIDREKRLSAIDVALEKKIPLNEGGAIKVNEEITRLGDKISSAISSARGKEVPIDNLFEPVRDLRKFYDNAIGTSDDIAWLDSFIETESKRLGDKFPNGKIPIKDAQELKQNTYRLLKNKYGELKSVQIEAQKQVARGLRQEIEDKLMDALPELQKINREQGTMIDLSSFIDRALNRTSNYDIWRLTTKGSAGAGGMIGGKTGAVVGAIVGAIIDDPSFKSKLAIKMNQLSKTGRDIKYGAGLRNYAFEAGKIPAIEQP